MRHVTIAGLTALTLISLNAARVTADDEVSPSVIEHRLVFSKGNEFDGKQFTFSTASPADKAKIQEKLTANTCFRTLAQKSLDYAKDAEVARLAAEFVSLTGAKGLRSTITFHEARLESSYRRAVNYMCEFELIEPTRLPKGLANGADICYVGPELPDSFFEIHSDNTCSALGFAAMDKYTRGPEVLRESLRGFVESAKRRMDSNTAPGFIENFR